VVLKEMEIGSVIAEFLVQVVIATASLWLAMKLTKVEGSVVGLFAAAFTATLLELIYVPYVGWILPFVVLLVLISRWTNAEIWPDAVLMVVVAWGLEILFTIGLRMVLV